jgi:hypothetical protein
MGGASYPMNINNQNYQKSLAEDLKGVAVALENAIEQLDYLIDTMTLQCDCEDGCCK